MEQSRPIALFPAGKKHSPARGGATTVDPFPTRLQSPEQVTAYAIWWVRQNWHLAECRQILAGQA